MENVPIGHYRIERLLGRGGMGEVYAGFDERLHRAVALKSIRADHRLDAQARARFLREARFLSQLDHPGICRIYDYVEHDGQHFLVLELIDGEPLARAIERGIDRRQALAIAEGIADVLVAAHAAGVVHRDLKPENVMLTRTGRPKVLDFGLARITDPTARTQAEPPPLELPASPPLQGEIPEGSLSSAPTQALPAGHLTEAGSITGTPMYMSPEQAAGELVSAASDMYSFGLLLQRLFTGELPYDVTGGFDALIERVRRAETLPLRGLDPHLTRLVERLKSRAPGARPTAAEAVERLRWIRGKPRRRLRDAAIAAGVVVIVLATLKYTVDLTRARDVAEARRGQAESLSEFMLFDLRKQLEPMGRLDLLADVGAKAMEYFAAIPAGDRTEEELYRHSRALTQIGEVRSAQGDLPGALEAFRESLSLAQELARRAPDDRERQLGLAASQFWVGYVSWRHEQLDEATDAFEVYREIAERLVARHPGDAEVRLELGYAHSNLGSVLESRGDLPGALAHFRKCLAIESELAKNDPENADLQLDVAKSHNAVGNVLAFQGQLREALENYLADLAIKQRLHERAPDNMTWRYELAVSHNLAANLYGDLGRVDETLAHIDKAASIAEALVAHDPSNERWGRELAIDIKLRATYARHVGGARREPSELERAVRILREASARDATDKRLKRELATTLSDLARDLAERGDRDGAERCVQEATGLVEVLLQEDAQHSPHAVTAGTVYEAVGVIRERSQREDEARAAWMRALGHVETAARESSDPRVLALQARLLTRLGRWDEARPIAHRIREMGYRDVETFELFESPGLLPRGGSAVRPLD